MRRAPIVVATLVVVWVNRRGLGRWLTDHTKGTHVVTVDPPSAGDTDATKGQGVT